MDNNMSELDFWKNQALKFESRYFILYDYMEDVLELNPKTIIKKEEEEKD